MPLIKFEEGEAIQLPAMNVGVILSGDVYKRQGQRFGGQTVFGFQSIQFFIEFHSIASSILPTMERIP